MKLVVRIITLFWMLGNLSSASAGDVTTSAGQPLCDTADHLQEWLLAALQKNARWSKEMSAHCSQLREGLSVGVIDVVSGDEDIKVLKVRVFAQKSGSATGYTISAGLKGY